MFKQKGFIYLVFIFTIGLSFFLHKDIFSLEIQGLHTWRQSQTMWNIRNFVRHDSNILNPRVSHFNEGKDNVYRMEFPLMQWGIAMLQKVGGEKIEIVRFSIFLIGIASFFGIYCILFFLFKDVLVAIATAFLFQFGPIFFYYTLNPIPDNLALAAGIWYIYFILKYESEYETKHLIWASIALLIASLAKLPFLMFAIMSCYFFFKNKNIKQKFNYTYPQLLIVLPTFVWYAWVMPQWPENPVTHGIFSGDVDWNNYLRILDYHRKTMFPDLILYAPVWLFFILGLYGLFVNNKKHIGWMLSLVFITFTYFFLELIPIDTVHDYYMMPFLPWMYIIVGMGIYTLKGFFIGQKKLEWVPVFLLSIFCVYSPIYAHKYTLGQWDLDKTFFNNDLFIHREVLKNAVPQNEHCIILNDYSLYIFSYQIDKMGHVFANDILPAAWVKDMIKNLGVTYMYSDSQKVNSDPELAQYIDHLVVEKGSIKVFKLKDKSNF